MGKEPLNAGQVTSDGVVAVQSEVPAKMETNDAIKNLSGRQYQNVMRIVRQFSTGKINKQQASLMLKNGFGFTDADINKQIFLYLAYEPPTDTTVANVNLITNTDFAPVAGVEQTTQAVLVKKSYMGMYLTDTNDLIVTFVSQGTPYSTRPIKNIPFYTPFRITVVVEDKSFSVFINGQQAFQRIVPGVLTFSRPAQTPLTSKLLKFYPPPFGPPIYVQNLHLWPRAISYKEVQRAQPALALESDFGSMPTESVSGTCS
jgi:hypothetical protein